MSFNGRELGKLVRVRGSIYDSPVGCVEQRNSRFQHWISMRAAVCIFDLKMGFSFFGRNGHLTCTKVGLFVAAESLSCRNTLRSLIFPFLIFRKRRFRID